MVQSIQLIAAVSRNKIIGENGSLPWRFPKDLKFFKEKTIDKSLIMGRRTFESIPSKLPGREVVVLSKNNYKKYEKMDGVIAAKNGESAIHKAFYKNEQVVISGGRQVYKYYRPRVDTAYITLVNKNFNGDCKFINLGKDEWILDKREDKTSGNGNTNLIFLRLKRKKYSKNVKKSKLNANGLSKWLRKAII